MSTQKTEKNQSAYDKKLAAKKAAVLGSGKKGNRPAPYIAIGICGLMLVLLGFFAFNKFGDRAQAVPLADQVTHPIKLFDDNRARHFQLDTTDGVSIRYFVVKSSDGVIRAAFDACDVCWPAGKGYYQEGDHMVCRNCGKRFASVKVNEVKGGCNPAPLERKTVGDNLVIRVRDILEGRPYFNLSERS
jgi:uncharacterized membrane protein